MKHLTPDAWSRLRAGTLAPDERLELLAHLGDDCEQCDTFVAGVEEPVLDGAVDAALASLSRAPAPGEDRLAAIERKVKRAVLPRRRARWGLALVPIAAAALAVWFVPRSGEEELSGQRLKGEATPSLTAVASVVPGAALEPLTARDRWPWTAELFFTYTLTDDAFVYLARVGVDGQVEAFYPPKGMLAEREAAGTRPLTLRGTVQAYALSGLSGRQRFVLLAAPEPLEGEALEAALKAGGPRAQSLTLEVFAP